MKSRILCAAVLGSIVAAVMYAQAQSPGLPETYSLLAAGSMGGPMTIKVNRNGSKELVELKKDSGDFHFRQLYDFQAHKLYTLDLTVNRCTTQEYASPYAPVMHDPIGGSEEMRREMATNPPNVLRTENVNGIRTKVIDAVLPGGQGKYTIWLEEKAGFPVKQTITMGSQPERLVLEIRQISYAPSPANLFTPPAECTRIGGVTTATGGRAEFRVEAEAAQTQQLGRSEAGRTRSGAPASAALKSQVGTARVTAVRLRLVPERYAGPCPSLVKLVGDITTDGPGTVWYEFLAGAVKKNNPAVGTVVFNSAATQTVTLEAEYVRTPSVPETSLIAVMADEQGRRGLQNLSSEPVHYNAACTGRAPAARR